MKKKNLTILLWVLTGFMVISSAVFFPSAASIIMLLFAAVAIPLEKVQNFWKSKKLQGLTKGILLVVLFLVAVGLAPIEKNEPDESPADQQEQQTERSKASERLPDEPASNANLADDKQQDVKPEEKPGVDAESGSNSEPDKTDTPAEEISSSEPAETDQESVEAPEPEPEPEPEPAEESEKTSYVLNSGTMKFHRPHCSSVSDIKQSNRIDFSGTRDEAIAKGYTACKNCNP